MSVPVSLAGSLLGRPEPPRPVSLGRPESPDPALLLGRPEPPLPCTRGLLALEPAPADSVVGCRRRTIGVSRKRADVGLFCLLGLLGVLLGAGTTVADGAVALLWKLALERGTLGDGGEYELIAVRVRPRAGETPTVCAGARKRRRPTCASVHAPASTSKTTNTTQRSRPQ